MFSVKTSGALDVSRVQTRCAAVSFMKRLHVPGMSNCVALPSASVGFIVILPNPSWLTKTTFFPESVWFVPDSISVSVTSTVSTMLRLRSIRCEVSAPTVIGIRNDSMTPSPLSIGAATMT